eukprot:scaffold17437_cov173-Amphora_coffeaeformis.AAC.5
MIGFGFVDQTEGLTFGLSTLTAAALGQVCGDASGVEGRWIVSLPPRGLPTADLAANPTPITRCGRHDARWWGVLWASLWVVVWVW